MPYIHIQPHSPQILGIKELLRNLAKPEQMLKYSFLLRFGESFEFAMHRQSFAIG